MSHCPDSPAGPRLTVRWPLAAEGSQLGLSPGLALNPQDYPLPKSSHRQRLVRAGVHRPGHPSSLQDHLAPRVTLHGSSTSPSVPPCVSQLACQCDPLSIPCKLPACRLPSQSSRVTRPATLTMDRAPVTNTSGTSYTLRLTHAARLPSGYY